MPATDTIADPGTAALKNAADHLFPILTKIKACSIEPVWLVGSYLRASLTGIRGAPESDIDLVFFNERETSRQYEKELESRLKSLTGLRTISLKNQARIAVDSDGMRYSDVFESIEGFPDVTIALAARVGIADDATVTFFAPYGLSWIHEKTVRPTARFLSTHPVSSYYSWIYRKQYSRKMPRWGIDMRPCSPSISARLCHLKLNPRFV